MNITESTVSAFRALKANKLRTILTMLGIIIGVFSVVLLVSLVRGVQNYISDQFESIGSNLIFVMPGRGGFNQDPATAFTDNKLKISHVSSLKTEGAEFINDITPLVSTGKTITYKNNKYFSAISAGYGNYQKIFNIDLSGGVFFTDADDAVARKVVILGSQVGKNLFGSADPIGKTIKIDSNSFEVIGLMKQKSQDFDESIVVPYNTAKDFLGADEITYITIKLKDDRQIETAMRQVESILLADLKRDDFTVMNQQDLLSSIQNILGILALGLGAVAAISLLVGGIGIMNIMLVAVGERIKEIGLRKAVGATSFDIGLQFITEATLLSLTGGLIGLLLGFGGSFVARQFIRTETPLWAILVSLGFSLFVGIVFGTYPAIRASKKEPVEALRYE